MRVTVWYVKKKKITNIFTLIVNLSILISPFHSVVFTILQSERNFFSWKGTTFVMFQALIGELVVWHLMKFPVLTCLKLFTSYLKIYKVSNH
jgi:hypothetical protein